jgi:hypothetical protein
MRIISQLVPSGQPVSTDIEALRKPGNNIWEIPTWGHPLALGVYPLFIKKDRHLIPVGTTFCISKLGVAMTSSENIRESVRRHYCSNFISDGKKISVHSAMSEIEMAVFHHQSLPGGIFSGNILNLKCVDEASPTDICYVIPRFQSGFLYLQLPLSFAVPRIGSRVICVGYSKPSLLDAGFFLNDIKYRCTDLLSIYERRFLATEARVTHIFTNWFTHEFIGGPCFIIDAEIEQGMIGGPVFSEDGYVCGIISAASTNFFGKPASIVSLLYPALGMNVKFGGDIGSLRINSNRRLTELIARGVVITDNSENLVTKHIIDGQITLNPVIHGEDTACIYDDFPAFQKGQHSI